MNSKLFFYRNSIYSKSNNQVAIIDFDNPEENREVLDPWFALVFQLADGQHTIEELIDHLKSKYDGSPPNDLLNTIDSVVGRMAKSKLIVTTDKKTDLPYYLSLPYEQMDIEMAKKLIKEDNVDNGL